MVQAAMPSGSIEDNDGFLKQMSLWTREVAEELARKNDIDPLTEDHWKVIDFVRSYYVETGEGPPIVRICKATGFSSRYVCQMFPCGVARGAYRLAGLPRPHGCL
ncbi:MAG: TusE/DsrC/DsvC family sulfur relay protein [Candidatus Zixiibacteriota bacterium]